MPAFDSFMSSGKSKRPLKDFKLQIIVTNCLDAQCKFPIHYILKKKVKQIMLHLEFLKLEAYISRMRSEFWALCWFLTSERKQNLSVLNDFLKGKETMDGLIWVL